MGEHERVAGLGIGVGAVGHGGSPSPHRTRPDLCASEGHPGVTYNPWSDATWCLCGQVVTDGEAVAWPKPTDCGGPLVDCHPVKCRATRTPEEQR